MEQPENPNSEWQSRRLERWEADLASWRSHPVSRLLRKQWGLKRQEALHSLGDGSLSGLTDAHIAREVASIVREMAVRRELLDLSAEDLIDIEEEIGDAE